MDRQTDTDGRTDGRTRTDGRMNGRTHRRTAGTDDGRTPLQHKLVPNNARANLEFTVLGLVFTGKNIAKVTKLATRNAVMLC